MLEKKPSAATFALHQDNQYSGFKDQHFQFWISLTAMTADNGGLQVLPGSHKGMLKFEKEGSHVAYKGDVTGTQFISAEPGDVVLFLSYPLHSTTSNVTHVSRWAYVIEYLTMSKIDPYIETQRLIVAKN